MALATSKPKPETAKSEAAPKPVRRQDGQASTEGASPGSGPAEAPPKERVGGVFVANTTFATELDGAQVIVHKGQTRVRAGHVLLERAPGCFDPVDLDVHFDVEQATAAPGERRGRR